MEYTVHFGAGYCNTYAIVSVFIFSNTAESRSDNIRIAIAAFALRSAVNDIAIMPLIFFVKLMEIHFKKILICVTYCVNYRSVLNNSTSRVQFKNYFSRGRKLSL